MVKVFTKQGLIELDKEDFIHFPPHGLGLPLLPEGYVGWVRTGINPTRPDGYPAYWNGAGFDDSVKWGDVPKGWNGKYISSDDSARIIYDDAGVPKYLNVPVIKHTHVKGMGLKGGSSVNILGWQKYHAIVSEVLKGGAKVVKKGSRLVIG